MLNMEVRQIFKTRAKIISYIRSFLDNLDFLEVSCLSGSLITQFIQVVSACGTKTFFFIFNVLFTVRLKLQ